MQKIIITILLLVNFGVLQGQEGINYRPKVLLREISKQWGIGDPQWSELRLPAANGSGERIKGKFFAVSERLEPNNRRFVYVGRVNSCRGGGCSASGEERAVAGDFEYFDYFILFGSDASVQQVRVFNYQATHGQEITSPQWLRQFSGFDGTKTLQVGGNVDAISGATISAYAIAGDVEQKTKLLKNAELPRLGWAKE
ncbi:MAG TPA: FMN-binding protein [Prolixibacteraceae bacterium]|nr:FMN-binding protein [Prolixibacteraceae bacterium]